MRSPLRLLLSPWFAVFLIVLVGLILIVASLVPEGSFILVEGGGELGGALRPVLAALSFMIAVAIGAATVVQARAVIRRSTRMVSPRTSGSEPSVDVDKAHAYLTKDGWRTSKLPGDNGWAFVRHPWSAWSGVVLHIGLLAVLIGLTGILATEARVAYIVREGDIIDDTSAPSASYKGPMARNIVLPGALRLVEVAPGYWPTGELREVRSALVDVATGDPLEVAINSVVQWRGLRLFQTQTYGRVFDVRLSGPGVEEATYRVDVETVPVVGLPAYRDIAVSATDMMLRLRSIEQERDGAVIPGLTARIEEGGQLLGQADLPLGEYRDVGDYRARLERQGYWQEIIMVDQWGAELLILGAVLVLLGSLAFYVTPLRRIFIIEDGECARVVASGGRFGQVIVRDDVASLLKECR